MTKTKTRRHKLKGGSFASATRRIWWSRKIGINQDKKKEWMKGYNAKKAELKDFADTFIADFDEKDFANGVCSNLYDPPIAWLKFSDKIHPQNYYFMKGKEHDQNKTYTFEETKKRLDPKYKADAATAIQRTIRGRQSRKKQYSIRLTPSVPNINYLDEVDKQMQERNKLFNEQNEQMNTNPNFTIRLPISINAQKQMAEEGLIKNPNYGTISKTIGGKGWFGLGKGFGKGFQHHMYYSKIKPNSDKKKEWKTEYNKTKKHLAKMKAEYFVLTEEKYAAGIYPKNIQSICTKTSPNPPNYYYIEGWKGDKVLGENLTYPEAKQRIDGMNEEIKLKQKKPKKRNNKNKTVKTLKTTSQSKQKSKNVEGLSPREQYDQTQYEEKLHKRLETDSNFREVSPSLAETLPEEYLSNIDLEETMIG